ncbi:MAG TPA: hypothetical protein IAB35_05595 [Candidatus Faecimonas gallistercoris]|nr:hypothetical protein [Candidatus Faecimonas gallistercoris]
MSLIECPECKKEISDKASSCPNCGCPITPELIEKEKRIKKMMMLRMERQNRKLAQENENRKKWKELGYDGISLDFVENSLSKEQIEKLFSDKILSKKIYSIFDETVSGCISSDKYYSTIFGKNAKEAGVRMVLDIPLRQETLLFTDNFLVVTYKEMTHFWKDGSYYSKYTYETIKDKLLVIPYFKILELNINSKNIKGAWQPVTQNKTGNATVGAVVGGALGGATGAVIGASVASKPRKVNIINGGSFNDDIYRFSLKVNRRNTITTTIEQDLFGISNTDLKIEHRSCWTYTMNNILFGSKHSLYQLSNREEADEICNEYISKYKSIINSSTNYELRKKVLNYINSNINKKIELAEYCSNKEFLLTIYKVLEENNADVFINIKDNIKEIINKYNNQDLKIENINKQINKLKEEKNSLSIFKVSKKKEIQNQISYLEETLNDLYYTDYLDISKKLYEIINTSIII